MTVFGALNWLPDGLLGQIVHDRPGRSLTVRATLPRDEMVQQELRVEAWRNCGQEPAPRCGRVYWLVPGR